MSVSIGAATKLLLEDIAGGVLVKFTVGLWVLIQFPVCNPVTEIVVPGSGTGATVMNVELGLCPDPPVL